MRCVLWTYKCARCGTAYEAPELAEGAYGAFLMRSTGKGATAYLNALDDPVYDEVTAILLDSPHSRRMTARQRADVLQSLFGVACDRDSDGSEFEIGRPPACPKCGSCQPESWEVCDPPKWKDEEVPTVSHEQWFKLGEQERKAVVFRRLHEIMHRARGSTED